MCPTARLLSTQLLKKVCALTRSVDDNSCVNTILTMYYTVDTPISVESRTAVSSKRTVQGCMESISDGCTRGNSQPTLHAPAYLIYIQLPCVA